MENNPILSSSGTNTNTGMNQPHIGSGESDNIKNKKFTWRSPSLIAVIVIFIAVGIYLLVSSSADTITETKVWSTAAAWNTGTLSDVALSGNSVALADKTVITTTPVTTNSQNNVDLALNRPAYASSVQNEWINGSNPSSYLQPKNVDDGNLTTRWSSVFSSPQWIYVDLGSSKKIAEVKLNWEPAYAKSYDIQVSNDAKTWTTIYSTTKNGGGLNTITGLNSSDRYVRMYGINRATPYGYSLYEMSIYGPPTTNTTTTTKTTTSYDPSGSITLTYDASVNATWSSISHQSSYPSGTALSYQGRTSTNNSTWSAWTALPNSGGSLSSLASSRYLQLKVTLSTANSSITPLLKQLTLNYSVNIASPTVSLATSTSSIVNGGKATLTWDSANSTSCTASGTWNGAEPISGSEIVSPTSTSTYNLSCSGSGGTAAAKSIVVTVTQSPPPVTSPTPTPVTITYTPTVVGHSLQLGNTGDQLKLKGVAVWGIQDGITQSFGSGEYANRQAVINTIKSWGANVVRFRVLASDYNNQTYMSKSQEIQEIKDWQSAAQAAGMYFQVTWWDSLDGPYNDANWASQYSQAFPMMKDVINALGPTNPWVIYEPFNEPNNVPESAWLSNMISTDDQFRSDGYKGVLIIDTDGWSHAYNDADMTSIENNDSGLSGLNGKNQIIFAKHDYANEGYSNPDSGFDSTHWANNDDGTTPWNFSKHLVLETEFGNYNGSSATEHLAWAQGAASWFNQEVSNGTLVGAEAFLFGPWYDANAMTGSDNTTPTQWGGYVKNGFF
jgi:hypothetical protein